MTPEHFRHDITSTLAVPGQHGPDKGRVAAKMLHRLVQALRNRDTINMTADGLSTQPAGGQQLLTVQSSGSTGAPKTIRRRPASWIASFEVTKAQYAVSASAPYAVLGSLTHSLTLYAVVEALHLGCDLTVLTGLSPRAQIAELREQKTRVLYATPTQLRQLIETGAAPLEPVSGVFCGGGKLDEATKGRAALFFPNADIREFFGSSETSFITISDASTPTASVGRAYPDVDLQVRDAKGCITDGAGEIWVRSPYLFDGYAYGKSDDTRWDGDYLSIGEFGSVDQAGNLTLLGRKNRMVTIADHNVFPELAEAHIQSNANVEKCAVVAIPDPLRGHVLVAIVERASDVGCAEALLGSCRSALGLHASPRRIEFVDRMPMLDAGKPDLMALMQMLEDDD
ncbi:AMP-binding protein [Aliiroseovarius sp. 2305UL8-7]|uniref:AMP-binding protein n=1 Tax=Aliiroseovarius conchicola TaxID=3121637 RepID=UPI0035292814